MPKQLTRITSLWINKEDGQLILEILDSNQVTFKFNVKRQMFQHLRHMLQFDPKLRQEIDRTE